MRLSGKPGHSATTANAQAIYPFQAEAAFGARGVYVGESRLGGAFCFDPFELYASKDLKNPNMALFGSVGFGKSSLAKTLLFRWSMLKDRRALIIDPKGEYGPLTRALGAEPIMLTPGGTTRLNPLHPGDGGEEALRNQSRMLEAVAAAVLERKLTEIEHQVAIEALEVVRREKSEPTIRDVAEKILSPVPEMARALNITQQQLKDGGQDIGFALRRLCEGPLKGMFDGPSTESIDFNQKVVTLDLSAVYSSTAIGIFMACAFGWLNQAIIQQRARSEVVRNIWVYDEAWKIFALHGVAEMLQDRLKIARSYGIANFLVMHRLTDLDAAGDAGTRTQSLVKGLLEDVGTHIIYRQPPEASDLLRAHYRVTETQMNMIINAGQGVGLWKVGERRFFVRHQLSPIVEPAIVDTDQQMVAQQTAAEVAA